MKCAILFGNDNSYRPHDENGCHMPVNHGGRPHEFIATDGRTYQWETDLMCTCDHCMKCEGDYCTVYWEKDSASQAASHDTKLLTRCAAGRDGECGHAQCPQLRDGEPRTTGRHCPLDVTQGEKN